jgi:hypothetical protein
MVHPVGFAGYGFQAAGGEYLKGRRRRVGSDANRPSARPAVLVTEPQSGFGKGHRQAIMKCLAGAVVLL